MVLDDGTGSIPVLIAHAAAADLLGTYVGRHAGSGDVQQLDEGGTGVCGQDVARAIQHLCPMRGCGGSGQEKQTGSVALERADTGTAGGKAGRPWTWVVSWVPPQFRDGSGGMPFRAERAAPMEHIQL